MKSQSPNRPDAQNQARACRLTFEHRWPGVGEPEGLARNHRMQELCKFCGLNITRSIQDRVFVGVMGLVFMVPTGYVLYRCYSTPWPKDMSIGALALVIFIDEVVLTVFLLSLCAFIWGVAAPRWIERFFEKTIGKFILILAAISLLLLGVMMYLFGVGV